MQLLMHSILLEVALKLGCVRIVYPIKPVVRQQEWAQEYCISIANGHTVVTNVVRLIIAPLYAGTWHYSK